MIKVTIPKNQKTIDKEQRLQRINDKKVNPKTNPTNKDIQDLLLDILEEIKELKK